MDRELKYALGKTVPIMFSYLFLSMAFGIMMNQAGFPFYWAYLVSLTVYTGAFQFVMVSFLSAATGIATIAFTALAMNCRHMFYGVTFLKEFKSMGKRYPYMIFSLTDETYALYCSLEYPENLDRHQIMFDIAWLSRAYWLSGTLVGALLGQMIPFDFYTWKRGTSTMRSIHILLSILVPAALTFGLRALPFLLLNKRELPKRMEYLGKVFPMAIMATLVVYCLKSIPESALQDNLILLAGVAVTAMVHLWKKSSILSITAGTVVYMALVHMI